MSTLTYISTEELAEIIAKNLYISETSGVLEIENGDVFISISYNATLEGVKAEPSVGFRGYTSVAQFKVNKITITEDDEPVDFDYEALVKEIDGMEVIWENK